MDFALIRLQSDGKTAKAPIERELTVIGRQTGCQLRIRSAEVSRKHAEIRYEEPTLVLKDLGSSNGDAGTRPGVRRRCRVIGKQRRRHAHNVRPHGRHRRAPVEQR